LSYDPFDPASPEARHAALTALRAEGEVHVPDDDTPWLLVGRDAVTDALKQVERFVGSFGDSGGIAEDDQMIAAIREPRHGRIRRVVNAVLAPHKMALVEPFVRKLADRLLDDVVAAADGGTPVDLVERYIDPIPTTVIAHVLGVPTEDAPTFKRWSDELLERQGTHAGESTLAETHPEFAAYLDEQIAAHQAAAEPSDDLIDRFLRTEVDGEQLSPRAVRTQVMFLIVAGNETTRNLLGNVLYSIGRDPGLYARLRADRSLVTAAIEESLRIDSPVQVLSRSCTADATVAGTVVPSGTRCVVGVASANRDERYYDDPAAFSVDRSDPRDHVAFGTGPHVCPGASLARLEAHVGVDAVLDRIEHLELAPGYEFDPNPVFWAQGPRSLPVLLTPAD
jgi:cytochrome P450